MYGTVAYMRVAPDKLNAYEERMRTYIRHPGALPHQSRQVAGHPSGGIAAYNLKVDRDGCQRILIAIFDSRESYRANAESPEQDSDYRVMRADLVEDPIWHDGEVEPFAGPTTWPAGFRPMAR
jgi:hypothetical protein